MSTSAVVWLIAAHIATLLWLLSQERRLDRLRDALNVARDAACNMNGKRAREIDDLQRRARELERRIEAAERNCQGEAERAVNAANRVEHALRVGVARQQQHGNGRRRA